MTILSHYLFICCLMDFECKDLKFDVQKKKRSSGLCHILNRISKQKHGEQCLGRNSCYWKSESQAKGKHWRAEVLASNRKVQCLYQEREDLSICADIPCSDFTPWWCCGKALLPWWWRSVLSHIWVFSFLAPNHHFPKFSVVWDNGGNLI